jgi:hypothetical protein
MLSNTSANFGGIMGIERFSPLENLPPGMVNNGAQQIIVGFFAATSSVPTGQNVNLTDCSIGEDLEQTSAYLYGHLPAIGAVNQDLGYETAYPPAVLVESYKDPHNGYRLRDALLEPEFYGTGGGIAAFYNPKSYRTPYGGPGELFYIPSKLSITETQSRLAADIANQQVNHITSGGQANGPDYTWQGSTYLEPIFQTTNSDALQSESDYAFLSGILFGVAGAAAIAFLQEIPETFSRPRLVVASQAET